LKLLYEEKSCCDKSRLSSEASHSTVSAVLHRLRATLSCICVGGRVERGGRAAANLSLIPRQNWRSEERVESLAIPRAAPTSRYSPSLPSTGLHPTLGSGEEGFPQEEKEVSRSSRFRRVWCCAGVTMDLG